MIKKQNIEKNKESKKETNKDERELDLRRKNKTGQRKRTINKSE